MSTDMIKTKTLYIHNIFKNIERWDRKIDTDCPFQHKKEGEKCQKRYWLWMMSQILGRV